MDEHWVKTLVNSMAAKIIAFALFGLLAITVLIGLFTNKHVKIFGIEFNEGRDTLTKIVYLDTTPKTGLESHNDTDAYPTSVVTSKSGKEDHRKTSNSEKGASVSQKNSKGDNNYVGGDNNGIVGGTNNTILKEKELTKDEQKDLLDKIRQFQESKGLLKCVQISTTQVARPSILNQIRQLLIAKGFEAYIKGTVIGDIEKYRIEESTSTKCVFLIVGNYY